MSEKKKLTIEYEVNSSPRILFGFISEPKGLSQWFADEVIYKDHIFNFVWDGETHRAKMANSKDNKLVRFNWLDADEGSYFEIEILQDEITNDVGLAVTDFVAEEHADERRLIWDNQIQYLNRVLGV